MQICEKESASLHNASAARTGSHRWITVGTVWQRFVMIRNWGVPDVVEINWRGWNALDQPHTFLKWDALFSHIRRRLESKGLRVEAVASSVEKNIYGQPALMVLVARDGQLAIEFD